MESNRWLSHIFCDICNVHVTSLELLLEHYDNAGHEKLLASYPENGVKLKGLQPGYDEASLQTLIDSYGTTIFTSCPRRSRYASFVFQDTRSAYALLAARKVVFCGKKVKVKPLHMQRPHQTLQDLPTVNGQALIQSGSLNMETLHLNTQEPLDTQAESPTSTQKRRSRRRTRGQRNGGLVMPNQRPNNQETFEDRKLLTLHRQEKCVQVRSLSLRSDLSSLEVMMAAFGKIVRSSVSSRGKNAVFEYQDSSSAAAALNFGRIDFDGRKLVVRPWIATLPSAEGQFLKTARKAIDCLNANCPTEEQLADLEQSITDLVECREGRVAAMLSDISDAINSLYPGMVLHPFGSSATGLAFFDSDLDLFIELPVPDKLCVIRVTDQLRRAGHPFCEVVSVLGAKTPLVKFKHARTGLRCDVSFKNCLGVRNSRLLRHYIDMHPRVRQLMMTVKLWARIQGVASGRGGATSYALVLMVIFFLQRLGFVPPIANLMQSEDHAETVDGWACGFCPCLDKISIEQSLAYLLKAFYSYYSNFKWESFVVCPLLGKEVDRKDLLDADKLPPEMGPLKVKLAANESLGFQSESSRAMCVQDPFALDHNLTRGIVPSKARDLFNLIVVSEQAIALTSDELLLTQLLSAENAKIVEGMTSSLCRIQFPRPQRGEQEWVLCLWRHLAKVLTAVLKLRVTPVVCGKRSSKVELDCCGYHDTVTGRAKVEKKLLAEDRDQFEKLSPIARQVVISDRLLGESVVKKIPEIQGEDSGNREVSDSAEISDAEYFDEDDVTDTGDIHLENPFSVLEDVADFESDSGDGLEEAETDLAGNVGSVLARVEDNDDEVFTFMKEVDFPWDSELVDPVGSKPIVQFLVRSSKRRNQIVLSFQNNGPFGKFVRELRTLIKNQLGGWITAELNHGC